MSRKAKRMIRRSKREADEALGRKRNDDAKGSKELFLKEVKKAREECMCRY